MTSNNDTGPHCFTMPSWISRAPFEQLLGMETVKAEAGEAVLRLPFIKTLAQGAGLMHGGALVSLADTAVVMAIKSIVAPGTHFATISLESRFFYPVRKGVVTAKANVAERQDDILKGICIVLDDSERSVMRFTSVFKIARDAVIRGVRYADASLPMAAMDRN